MVDVELDEPATAAVAAKHAPAKVECLRWNRGIWSDRGLGARKRGSGQTAALASNVEAVQSGGPYPTAWDRHAARVPFDDRKAARELLSDEADERAKRPPSPVGVA